MDVYSTFISESVRYKLESNALLVPKNPECEQKAQISLEEHAFISGHRTQCQTLLFSQCSKNAVTPGLNSSDVANRVVIGFL